MVGERTVKGTAVALVILAALPSRLTAPTHAAIVHRDVVAWQLARTIERIENTPRAWHNPGALRQRDGRFHHFATYQQGWAALVRDLRAKRRRGMTRRAILRVWSEEPERYEELAGKIESE